MAAAISTRDPTRFPSITSSIGTPGGLDAYVVQFSTSTGAVLSTSRLATNKNDSARAIVYSGASLYLAAVVEGSLSLALVGANDLAVLKVDAAGALQAATSYPVTGEVRINGGLEYNTTPVFVGAGNFGAPGVPAGDFQAFAFQINSSLANLTTYWLPQPGGDSEAFSGVADASGNLFLGSMRRVFPQPVGWNFIRVDRIAANVSAWQTTWTAASQYRPALIITPEFDVYVRTGTSLRKIVRDAVHFDEALPSAAPSIALANDKLISVSGSTATVRLGR